VCRYEGAVMCAVLELMGELAFDGCIRKLYDLYYTYIHTYIYVYI